MDDIAAAREILIAEIRKTGPQLAAAHNWADLGRRQFCAGYLDACVRLGELLGISDAGQLRAEARTAASGAY